MGVRIRLARRVVERGRVGVVFRSSRDASEKRLVEVDPVAFNRNSRREDPEQRVFTERALKAGVPEGEIAPVRESVTELLRLLPLDGCLVNEHEEHVCDEEVGQRSGTSKHPREADQQIPVERDRCLAFSNAPYHLPYDCDRHVHECGHCERSPEQEAEVVFVVRPADAAISERTVMIHFEYAS